MRLLRRLTGMEEFPYLEGRRQRSKCHPSFKELFIIAYSRLYDALCFFPGGDRGHLANFDFETLGGSVSGFGFGGEGVFGVGLGVDGDAL